MEKLKSFKNNFSALKLAQIAEEHYKDKQD